VPLTARTRNPRPNRGISRWLFRAAATLSFAVAYKFPRPAQVVASARRYDDPIIETADTLLIYIIIAFIWCLYMTMPPIIG
jgi:uncharacterized membrane protein required for colicin V production